MLRTAGLHLEAGVLPFTATYNSRSTQKVTMRGDCGAQVKKSG
jgi:hypothetical protein